MRALTCVMFAMMNKSHPAHWAVASLLLCGACSTVQQTQRAGAPVVDGSRNAAAAPATVAAPGRGARQEEAGLAPPAGEALGVEAPPGEETGETLPVISLAPAAPGLPYGDSEARALEVAPLPAPEGLSAPESGPTPKPRQFAAVPVAISNNPAVAALLDEAKSQAKQGHAAGAVNALERALRLEPKNPYLWHLLAALRIEQGQWQQALSLAGKSNSLAGRLPKLQAANARLMDRARQGSQ